jgi:FtsH-binding integral membrane protein
MEYRDPFAAVRSGGQAKSVAYDLGLRAYMLKIYNYMASALALTGVVAMLAAQSESVMGALYQVQNGHVGMSGLGWLVALAPLGLIMWLGFGINRLSVSAAQGIFWLYAALVGLSLTSIFVLYTGESIAKTFFVTAGTFGGMSLYGYTTKKDLSGFGSFLIMGLWGLIIASVVNMFMHSSALSFATSVIGVLIFVGLTAYDTQKLKSMYYQVAGSSEAKAKASIMGALNLYLDFLNIFLHLLRFMGDRK